MRLVYPKRMVVGDKQKHVFFVESQFIIRKLFHFLTLYLHVLQEIERRRALLRVKVVQQREEEVRA